MASQQFIFSPFRFDPVNSHLWRQDRLISLRPKARAVLRLLLEKHGQIVSPDDIFHTVWPDIVVSDTVLKGCIREIREALGDEAGRSRFIETFPKLG